MRSRNTAPLFLCLLAASAAAQTKTPPASVPLIEDPELYYAFFNYHQGLVTALQASKAAAPQNSAQLDQQMASLLGLNLQELPAVIANTAAFIQALADLAIEKQTKLANPSSVPGNPTAAQLNAAFEFKRIRITVEAFRLLNSSLSPASWTGIHNYITGTYKNTIYKH